MKGPSLCESFGEPLDVPSCEEKGSAECSDELSPENQGLHEPSDEPFFSHEGSGKASGKGSRGLGPKACDHPEHAFNRLKS